MRRRGLGLTAAVLLALGAPALADEFADGNLAYREGHYVEAVALYEALAERGVVHEDLYYNLGNAYFRSGQLGRAAWSYERALRVEPGMADAAYNLEVARTAIAARVTDRLEGAEAEPLWVRTVGFFSMTELVIGFLALDLILFGLLVAVRFLAVGFARTAIIATTGFVAVALAGNLALLGGQVYQLERVAHGVVVADQVVMREGPDHSLAERGQLHPGLKVRILGEQAGWLKVRLANGVEGWLTAEAVGRL